LYYSSASSQVGVAVTAPGGASDYSSCSAGGVWNSL
jgi:hypothetical protein